MKICQIGVIEFNSKEGDISRAVGGISSYIYELLLELLKKDLPVKFIGKIYNYQRIEGLDYIEIQKSLTSTNKFLVRLFIKSLFIKLEKDTIVHAHRPDNLAAVMFFKRNPSVLTIHGQQAITVYKRKNFIIKVVYTLLERFAIKKANYIITTDKITLDYYTTHYNKYKYKMAIIPTGINMELFRPLNRNDCRLKYNINSSLKIALYIGRIEPPKRTMEIVLAFDILHKSDPNTLLMIIGAGQQLEDLKSLVEELKLEKDVVFYGARQRQDLPELINCADISVLYSGNEGSPLSVKESLACGIPVVSNVVGDVDTIIEPGKNGYLVVNETIDSLAYNIMECISKEHLMKEACLRSCEKYSINRINEEIINLYKMIPPLQ